ncbi:MAG: glycosyltransferase family 4 protein, partial [Candidatus Micrarchaeia archaeon]
APKLKNIEFIIVGKGCRPEIDGNVHILGEVKNIDYVMKKADAFIAPLISGKGLKTKILTYFEYKKPVIGTSLAFRGYNVKNRVNCIIEDNVDKFYLRIDELNEDPRLIKRIQSNMDEVLLDFSEKELKKKMNSVLNKVN